MSVPGANSENAFFRSIKTFVMRGERMTRAQKTAYESALHAEKCIEFASGGCTFEKLFGNTQSVIAEIGFGMGDATVKIAEKNPDKNYIGIEVYKSGVARLLCEIEKRALKNILIIEHDALEVFAKMFPRASLAGIHIFFPDPWPKKKHHKRRLLQKANIERLTERLQDGGYIYFVTDWTDYAECAALEFAHVPALSAVDAAHNSLQKTLHDERGQTKFERKALKAGRTIHEFVYVKDGG
ncbi:MAG: tRNA (guanosine(46)-N7)-methyltransferase TrmB [Treponemataceae bacterium]|nr:MAG: tRNA (guanosine(46)-N7)-methyltransferase TrmB [Treponemataceae bacterium]